MSNTTVVLGAQWGGHDLHHYEVVFGMWCGFVDQFALLDASDGKRLQIFNSPMDAE